MKSYSATEASKRFGEMLKLADRLPIEITRHGRRQRYVLMSAPVYEMYEQIRQAHSEERVLATVQNALGKLMNGKDEEGFRILRAGSAMMARFLHATGEKV